MRLIICVFAMLLSTAAYAAGALATPKLERIEFSESIYLAKMATHLTVDSDGQLNATRTNGEKKESATKKLSADELSKLAASFVDWRKLRKSYGEVADGPAMSISYGDYKVTSGGGDDTPKAFINARDLLMELANSAFRESKPKK